MLRTSMITKSWFSVLTTEQKNPRMPDDNLNISDNYDDSSDNDINENIIDTNTVFYAMKKMLSVPIYEKLSPSLIAHYNCSEKVIELKGLLLSKNGLVHATHPNCDQTEHFLQFCNECLKSLEKGTKSLSYNAPPAHAIANHFFIGHMPDNLFHNATWVEHDMTSLVTNVASTRILRGGVRRAIRSHD